uniref:Uncharacterized protein n=1 Tax=Arundo donax TaxID=35708 RepID=A0A0A9F9J2_ARUDO
MKLRFFLDGCDFSTAVIITYYISRLEKLIVNSIRIVDYFFVVSTLHLLYSYFCPCVTISCSCMSFCNALILTLFQPISCVHFH